MHWSWKLAHGMVKASAVPPNPKVDIRWDHCDEKKSREATL
jgi:hypothetical protein